MTAAASLDRALVVIPCLNEERHLDPLVRTLVEEAGDALIVIADGGSTDSSRSIAGRLAAEFRNVVLLDNPRRLQAAGINLAVERFGSGRTWLVRVDAHCSYPEQFLPRLLRTGERLGVSSVVVPMNTRGETCFQKAVAAAQNSVLGTGGSAHRISTRGQFVDHGHHALMRIDAFRSAGGYCEMMSHNEDAELDVRLRARGAKIWLEPSLAIEYFPRATPTALFAQYLRYGGGRAQTTRRHNIPLRARQAAPLLVAPALLLSLGSVASSWFAAPLLAWAAVCLIWGVLISLRSRSKCELMAGPAAMIMHLAWSMGFWRYLLIAAWSERDKDWRAGLRFRPNRPPPTPHSPPGRS